MAGRFSDKGKDASPHDTKKLISISLKILLALVVLIAVVATFYESMTFYDHDEQMYLPAARQILQGKSIYKDFAFNQTPYVPLIFATVIKISGTHHYLLTGKLINLLLWVVSAAILYLSARRFSGDIFLAACLLVLYLFDFYVTRVSIVATNYNIPITFALLGGYLMLTASGGGNPMRLLVAGLCMAVAVGAKLFYLPLLLPFGLVVFYPPCAASPPGGAWRRLWPLVLGMGLGLLPAFYYFFRDPSGFIFHNIQYHIINIEWRKQIGHHELLDLASKFWWVLGTLKDSNYFVLFLWLVFDSLLLISARRRLRAVFGDFPVAFLAGSTLIALAAACFPRPLWPQYFAMPVPYWLLLIAAMHKQLHRPLRTMNRCLAFAAVLTVLALTLPQKFQTLAVSLGRSPTDLAGCRHSSRRPGNPQPARASRFTGQNRHPFTTFSTGG